MSCRRGIVALVMRPMFWPLRELATSGRETSTRGMPQRTAVSASNKLSSAPESRRADVFWVPPSQSRITGRQVRLQVEDSIGNVPTSAPRSTSGHALLLDGSRRNAPLPCSTGMIESSPICLSPPSSVGIDPPSSPPARLRN